MYKLKTFQTVSNHDSKRAYEGYTLFNTVGTPDVWLIDMNGNFVHRWTLPHELGVHAELLPSGRLLAGLRLPTGPLENLPAHGGAIVEVDWDSQIEWKYEDPYLNSHDRCRMPNGNTLVKRWVAVPDELAAKIHGGLTGTEKEGTMWGDCFQEITSEGSVVWEWTAHDHLDFDRLNLCPLCPRTHGPYVNSISMMPDGNILTSFRSFNAVAIIEKSSGDFKWFWQSTELAHQHQPLCLSNGNILIFDNGIHRIAAFPDPSYSRVIEVDPDTNKIEWEYTGDPRMSFYSATMGNVQRLPNGNTLICESAKGHIFEVTAEKEIVWEFLNPIYEKYREWIGDANIIYRAYRYGPDFPGLNMDKLNSNRFDWILQDNESKQSEKAETSDTASAVEDRLRRLGY